MRLDRIAIVLLAIPVGLSTAAAQAPAASSAPAKTSRTIRSAETVTPDGMKWNPTGAMFPAAGHVAVLYGNPELPRTYALRVKVADGSSEGPHWHGNEVQITVIQGTLLFGTGESFDEARLQKLGPGSFLVVPAGLRHYMAFQGETVYQMQGVGPLRTFAVRAVTRPVVAATPAVDTQKQKAEFDAAVAAFNQAAQAKDRNALNTTVRQEFERIARGGGPHSFAAREYLNSRIPGELVTPRGTCPVIGRASNVGWVVQEVKPGDVVAPALLDSKLEWTTCAWPEFPPRPSGAAPKSGIVRLTATLSEGGTVMSVKARGGIYPPGVYESAAAAVRAWRTNPPRAKGQAVKTEVSVDIPYSQ